MTSVAGKRTDSPDLVYGLEDRPPFGNALLSAITRLLAIFALVVTPTLIVGGALELPVEMTACLVSMTMVASGVGTYLQINRFRPVGSGMLSVQSIDFSFVIVTIALGMRMKESGLTKDTMISVLLDISFVGAFLVCFLTWLLPYLKKVITPTVSGVIVTLIGLGLIYVGITDLGGGFGAKANGTFSSMENLGLAPLVLLIVLISNCMKGPLLRMDDIAVGSIVGYIVALFLGKVDSSTLQNLPLVTLPVPFKYGFAFDWHTFIVAGAVFLLNVFEAVSNLAVTTMVSDQPIEGGEYARRLRGGVLADGLVSVIATALDSLPLTTFARDSGVIQMTGITSRYVGKYIAVILALLGLSPVVGRAFTTIPSPVLGGAIVLMFGLITIASVWILVSHDIRGHEAVIAATSVGLGLGVTFKPEVFKNLPVLFQNSISAGGITAVVLNLLLPEDKSDKVVKANTDGLEH